MLLNIHTLRQLQARSHSSRPRGWRQASHDLPAPPPPLSRLVARLLAWSIVSPVPRSLPPVEHCRLKRKCARGSCSQYSCSAMIFFCAYSFSLVFVVVPTVKRELVSSEEHGSNRWLFDSTVSFYGIQAVAAIRFQQSL